MTETAAWPYDADQHDPLTALGALARDKGCEFSGVSLDGTCGRTAVITATGGCTHEHVLRDLLVCQYHTEEVAAGDSYCRQCFEVDGHDCPIAFDPRSVRSLEATHPDVFQEATR